MTQSQRLKKPAWLKIKIPSGENYLKIKNHKDQLHLNTVCQEANCPNMGDCWTSGTASFMLMGDTCTRACRFCAVNTSRSPAPLDPDEPQKLTATLKDLNLQYIVLTTVDRDDLPDQGAEHIAKCVRKILESLPDLLIEVLIPDFQGKTELLDIVAKSGAVVISHNLECPRNLTPLVRDKRASYEQSLQVLDYIKKTYPHIYTKSSLMLGLGETVQEVTESMKDLRDINTDFLTLGQYLQPTKNKLPVKEYIHPDQFDRYHEEGLLLGFDYVASGPLVRSSYQAAEHYLKTKLKKK
jgi:lipoyl synthase